jgi:uncharacterized HAD superfamily protein
MEHAIQNQMQEVISKVEQHVDAEIEKLEKFDVDDFEKLRERRLANMKKEAKLKQEFLAMVIFNHQAAVPEYPIINLSIRRVTESTKKWLTKRSFSSGPKNPKMLFAFSTKREVLAVRLLTITSRPLLRNT